MSNQSNELMNYREAAQKIRDAILQSRYRSAQNANIELLNQIGS